MRGHLKQRSPGKWAIVLDVRDPETNKRRQRWHTFHGTKRQAQDECARLIAEMKGGLYVDPTRVTVGQFLDRWLAHMVSQLSPGSHQRYSAIARKNLVPALGAVHLTKLSPAQIADVYTKALLGGRRDGKGGLSAGTVIFMHRVLKQSLQQAVDWQLIVRNPADPVKPPKAERRQMQVPDDGGAALVEAARGTDIFMLVLLGVTTGVRRGEAAALRWRNVDLDNGRLLVAENAEQVEGGVRYKQPKSGRGRTVALSAMMVEELRAHRLRQAQDLLKLGVRLSDDAFVIAQADGRPYHPNSLSRAFQRFLAKHGQQHIRLHDLRHTHATAMLKAGIHGKIVQERLGHASITLTLDLYSHVVQGMQEEATERVDEALRIAMQKHRTKPIG